MSWLHIVVGAPTQCVTLRRLHTTMAADTDTCWLVVSMQPAGAMFAGEQAWQGVADKSQMQIRSRVLNQGQALH